MDRDFHRRLLVLYIFFLINYLDATPTTSSVWPKSIWPLFGWKLTFSSTSLPTPYVTCSWLYTAVVWTLLFAFSVTISCSWEISLCLAFFVSTGCFQPTFLPCRALLFWAQYLALLKSPSTLLGLKSFRTYLTSSCNPLMKYSMKCSSVSFLILNCPIAKANWLQ